MTDDNDEVLIDCQSLWKVFGDKSDAAIEAITERGLSKRQVLQDYNCVVGVSDASLQVRTGEIFCVMGLSGSGKSTLIRLLNRLITPTLGKVIVKGHDIATVNRTELRKIRAQHLGMVFQSVALLPHRTVLENSAFGLEVQGVAKEQRNKKAAEALEMVGLADWLEHYPNQLSGGMQQRVGLARAIAADPEIILMDEPFSALDPLIRRQLQDEFRELTKNLGKSAVFITHDLDEAIRIGDRIAIMNDGVIVQVGTAEEIILRPADSYVEQFVEGVSRLHLIEASTVMTPLAKYQHDWPAIDIDTLAQAPRDADIDQLIALTLQSESDAVAVSDNDEIIGVVTPRDLLRGLSETRTN